MPSVPWLSGQLHAMAICHSVVPLQPISYLVTLLACAVLNDVLTKCDELYCVIILCYNTVI